MELALKLFVVALCAAVIVGAVCRLDMLRAGVHRQAVIAMYTLMGAFAFSVCVELARGRDVQWHEIAAALALLLQLHLTRPAWTRQPPESEHLARMLEKWDAQGMPPKRSEMERRA